MPIADPDTEVGPVLFGWARAMSDPHLAVTLRQMADNVRAFVPPQRIALLAEAARRIEGTDG